MSFNVAASSIVTGVGLTIYGGYKYLTASRKSADEVSQQKKIGLGFVAVGVAAIAVGAGLIYSGETTPQMPENPVIPTVNELASIVEEVASCPINALKNLLNKGGSDSLTAKTFEVLEDTQGISCDNYLPWQNKFRQGGSYINSIQATDLQKPVMWGIDSWERPYIAIKYVCDQTKEGVMALFQSSSSSGYPLASGGEFHPSGCPLRFSSLHVDIVRPEGSSVTEFLGNLASFFKGENIAFSTPRFSEGSFRSEVSILTLAK